VTVSGVRSAALEQYRVVDFATHGLVAGEVNGLSEPALVLSLPDNPTADDDGLLTASRVAKLNLDADWAVLSACNTAAGDKPGAEGLSGLARAFFYAGARALLVSHWPVQSDAAVKLTTGAFTELAKHPSIGRAEALRRSTRALIADHSQAGTADPSVWAPFVLVGEGN
jgi:CHAT domain-containing protein